MSTRFGAEDIDKVKTATAFFADRYAHYGFDNRTPWNTTIMAKYTAQHCLDCARKGLALYGQPGRGKTHAMRVLGRIRGIRFVRARDIVDEWQRFGANKRTEFWDWINGERIVGHDPYWRDIIIDDIGTEPTLNEYGTKQEVIDTVIARRTTEYTDNEALTCLTFNLPLEPPKGGGDSIRARYGDRFLSRIHELCHVVQFRGNDWRREQPKETP